MVDCSSCPVREECGVDEEQVNNGTVYCPLTQLIREWRRRMLRRFLGWNIIKYQNHQRKGRKGSNE